MICAVFVHLRQYKTVWKQGMIVATGNEIRRAPLGCLSTPRLPRAAHVPPLGRRKLTTAECGGTSQTPTWDCYERDGLALRIPRDDRVGAGLRP